MGLLD